MPSPIQPSPPSEYLRTIARKGGQSKSSAKVNAVRANLVAANAARAARRAELADALESDPAGASEPCPRPARNPNRRGNKLPT